MNHKTEELVVQARHWAATKSAYRHLFTDLADAIEAESARADAAEARVAAVVSILDSTPGDEIPEGLWAALGVTE